jgi:hypothetical protein
MSINVLMELDASIFRVDTLKIDSVISSETLVPIYQTTRCHILDDRNTGGLFIVVWNITPYSLAGGYKPVPHLQTQLRCNRAGDHNMNLMVMIF